MTPGFVRTGDVATRGSCRWRQSRRTDPTGGGRPRQLARWPSTIATTTTTTTAATGADGRTCCTPSCDSRTGEAWLPRASRARAHRAYSARVHGAQAAVRVGGHVDAHGLEGGQTWPWRRATSCSGGATYGTRAQSRWWAAGSDIVAIPFAAGVLAPSRMVRSPAIGAVPTSPSRIILAVNAQLPRRVALGRASARGDAARGDEERPSIGRLSLLRAR